MTSVLIKPRAMACAFDQTGDIYKFHSGRNYFGEREQTGQPIQALIGHLHYTHMRLEELATCAPAAVMALKIVDLPALGSPTIPQLKGIAVFLACIKQAYKLAD